jgi:uncharacterized coiled-coil protein SlyX
MKRGLATLLCAASLGAAQAADEASPRPGELKQRIAEQARQLEELKRLLAAQEATLESLRRSLDAEKPTSAETRPAAPSPAPVVADEKPVGSAPPAAPPRVAPIFEQPGVLTPAGKFGFEPSLQYSYSSSNRIALVGYTVIPAILVGLIDVREVKRSTWTGALAGRWGLSNRLEVEAKLPYVYRYDTSIGREVLQGSTSDSSAPFDATGRGIGDIEFTARYQLNDGGVDKPYYVGSLRLKTRTGRDPFQVMTSTAVPGFRGDGVQTELPTGSGFYGLQPALTMLYPSDPAVFFGTVSYLYNVKRTNVVRSTDQGLQALGTIAPGGIFGFNFGMGLALNEKSSFSIGYDHSSVGKTRQNGLVAPDSVQLQLGTLLLGYSFRLDDRRTVNVSLGAGLTRDTPDVTLTLRVPTSF